MAWRRPGDKPLSEPMMVNFYLPNTIAASEGPTPNCVSIYLGPNAAKPATSSASQTPNITIPRKMESYHYNDVTMCAMASNHRHLDCLFNLSFRLTSKSKPASLSLWPAVSPRKGFAARKASLRHEIISSCVMHYNDVTWTSCSLKSPISIFRLFV